jgi:hypothetical protein
MHLQQQWGLNDAATAALQDLIIMLHEMVSPVTGAPNAD